MSQNTVLLTFAIINLLIVENFAATILRQYLRKRRDAQLYWSIALFMAFFATLAYILLVTGNPISPSGKFFFRLYYVLGAALTPIWLGLGSIALVTSQRVARTFFLLLSGSTILAVVTISEAPMNLQALAHVAGTTGTGVLVTGAWLPTIIVLNTLGVVAIVGVAIYSGWKLLRRQASVAGFQPHHLLLANVLILAGALFDAAAGTLSRIFGLNSSFWLVMAFGWIIFYLGVLLTGRRKQIMSQPTGPVPTTSADETRDPVTSA
jgi:hypothetical protein